MIPIRRTVASTVVAVLAAAAPAAAPPIFSTSAAQAAGTVEPLIDAGRLQRVFQAALERVEPTIVRIDTIGGAQPVQSEDGDGPPQPATGFRQADGPTTGVIWSPDGHILTSSINFVRDPLIITVTLHDGRRFVARLVARDRLARLALLKIEATDLPVPELASLAELRPGQWALAAGFGHASPRPAVAVGVISALDRINGLAIQTDAKISPANYGGPLFDLAGRVMGVCVPLSPQVDDETAGVEWYDSGIGFAIHTEYIAGRWTKLAAGEDLERGLLGISLDSRRPVIGEPDTQPASQPSGGVQIIGEPRGPAADAGLRAGDVITSIDGQPTPDIVAFRRVMARRAAGETIRVEYTRDRAPSEATLTLAPVDEFRQPASTPASLPAPTTQPR